MVSKARLKKNGLISVKIVKYLKNFVKQNEAEKIGKIKHVHEMFDFGASKRGVGGLRSAPVILLMSGCKR